MPPEFDSMVAKVIAYGRDRGEALARLGRALAESAIVLEGGTTNRAFLLELLSRPEVRSAEVDTAWLERAMAEPPSPRPHADVAFVQAAIEVYESEFARERTRFYETAARLRPEASLDCEPGRRAPRGRPVLSGPGIPPGSEGVPARGGRPCRLQARVEPLGRFERWLVLGERRYRIVSVPQDSRHLVEVDGIPHRFSRADVVTVRAHAPAVVVSLAVARGDEVKPGDPARRARSHEDGDDGARALRGPRGRPPRRPNTQVGAGTALLQLDTASSEHRPPPGASLFSTAAPAVPATARERALANLEAMRGLALGFDADPAETRALGAEYVRLAREWPGDDERRRLEDEILETFADLASLCRRQASPEEEQGDELGPTSAGEYFLTYLRTVEADGGRLPRRFLERLKRALAHYGHPEPGADAPAARRPALDLQGQRSLDAVVDVVMAILERRLETPAADPDFAALLDRLIGASEGRRPSLCDMAREVALPALRPAPLRARDEAGVRAGGSPSSRCSGQATRRRRASRADSRPRWLSPAPPEARLRPPGGRDPGDAGALLEILVRRYYRIRDLQDLAVFSEPGRAVTRG